MVFILPFQVFLSNKKQQAFNLDISSKMKKGFAKGQTISTSNDLELTIIVFLKVKQNTHFEMLI